MATPPSPSFLQKGDPSRAPLFLIHDAGGGVYNYAKLSEIGRPVYTIRNPWAADEQKWEGGVEIFVEKYVEMIRGVVGKGKGGDIIVGGFSLGGQLAIDIARSLALTPRSRLRVVGIVMIDTLYPYWGPPSTVHAEIPVELVLQGCPREMREEILRCTLWSKEDSAEWVRRNWKDTGEKKEGEGEKGGIEAEVPPPAVLLQATNYVPVKGGNEGEGGKVAMVDYLRHDKGGWELFPHRFLAAVWGLQGHHFGLFDRDTVTETSVRVRAACDLLAED